jgi:NADPH:quinone reductase-like Zn-dependent oxidoreductase
MRQAQLGQFGLEHLSIIDTEEPEAAEGQVVVKVETASLNYRDYLICMGFYKPSLKLPVIPLSDGAGVVTAVGEGVTSVSVGDRVSSVFWQDWPDGPASLSKIGASTGCEAPGMASEYAVLPESAVVRLPDAIDMDTAAAIPCAAVTAWTSLTTVGQTGPGDTVLCLGTGGVSLFALQIAKALGANVIITSSSDAKLERAQALGADHGINYRQNPEWGKEAFGLAGLGVNTVVETGGAGTLSQSIEALGWDGHIAYLGMLAGMSAELNLMGLVGKGAHLDGVMVGSRAEHVKLLEFIAEHQIEAVVDSRASLADLAATLGAMPGGQHFGKLLIEVG